MKKGITLIVIAVLICAATSAYAASPEESLTGGRFNGHFIDGVGEETAKWYVLGIAVGIDEIKPGLLAELYPDESFAELSEKVMAYYVSNPGEKSRPIVTVVLEGAK